MSLSVSALFIAILALLFAVVHWLSRTRLPWNRWVTSFAASLLIVSIVYGVSAILSEAAALALFLPLGLFSATCVLYVVERYEEGIGAGNIGDCLIDALVDLVPILACFVGVSLLNELLGYGSIDFGFGLRESSAADGILPVVARFPMSGILMIALALGVYAIAIRLIKRRPR
jgi:hypothetical protein